ncbi:MAG: phosphoribosylanthranilate isomerase [Chthoniobacterales bacterium]|nr:phosphoribosylanthranilate isomerase [Chthoniobacterales bacterium]
MFSDKNFAIKICGIRSEKDAWAAVEAGVDAIGFNFYPPSKRFVRLEDIESWACKLPVVRVAVVVNPDSKILDRIIQSSIFDAVQFHGDEESHFCVRSAIPWIKAFRGVPAIAELSRWPTPWILCDAMPLVAGEYGGTGRLANWQKISQLVDHAQQFRVFLAGGLTPSNVRQAIEAVRPFGVDVAGGVEAEDGRKSLQKMREFVQAARNAFLDFNIRY